jgi:hypothetical protein
MRKTPEKRTLGFVAPVAAIPFQRRAPAEGIG